MDRNDSPITEADLHAWLDGELPPDRAAAVEGHLADHPEELERLERYRAHAGLIARAYAPLAVAPAASPMPPIPVARRPWRRGAAAMAAAMLLFLAGTATGWLARSDRAAPNGARLAADALSAHVVFAAEVRHPVEVAADQEAHLVGWLSKRLGKPLAAPRLADTGFELMGGRLLSSGDGPAAQFMYQDAAGRRITLYARPTGDDGETSFRFAQDGAVSAFYWKDRGLSWALAGDIDRARLQDLAHRVYALLNS